MQSNLGQSLTKHQGVNTLGKNQKGLKIKRPPFLALASSSTFLYSLEKGLYNKAMQSNLGQSLTKHQGVNTLGKNKKGLKIKRPPFLALVSSSSSTFLYLVQKRLYNEAMQSKLGQSLTNHRGVNTLNKSQKDF